MYSFNWNELATDNLLSLLKNITGTDTDAEEDKIKNLLASIFKSIGGLPVAESTLNKDEITHFAENILSEALDRYFHLTGLTNRISGHYIKKSRSSSFEEEIVAENYINVNTANFEELEPLPIIGNEIANAIILERTENGYFESAKDLTTRIKGLGEKSEKLFKNIITFNEPTSEISSIFKYDYDLESKLKIAISFYSNVDPEKRLQSFLDNLASALAKKPHPKSTDLQIRDDFNYELVETSQVKWVSVLKGSQYYKSIPDLLKSADKFLKVAMFHIAYPKENHPTKTLLDELIKANERGVEVKVILDRDKESDPYKSTVINKNAKEYLENNGVSCKFDKEDTLLHSKYIVIDDKYCVIGSHNWSAGSYFQFDDLSFVINSDEIAIQLNERFDQLWKS